MADVMADLLPLSPTLSHSLKLNCDLIQTQSKLDLWTVNSAMLIMTASSKHRFRDTPVECRLEQQATNVASDPGEPVELDSARAFDLPVILKAISLGRREYTQIESKRSPVRCLRCRHGSWTEERPQQGAGRRHRPKLCRVPDFQSGPLQWVFSSA